MFEEIALPVDDRLRYPEDGVEALQYVLDQPARLLQLRGERIAAATARPRCELCIEAIDAQARHGFLVQAGPPDALHLAHHHIGYHVARLEPGEGGAGTGIQAADQRLRGAQRLVVGAGEDFQAHVVAAREKLEVLFADRHREGAQGTVVRVNFSHGANLQRQAFAGHLPQYRAGSGRR